MRRVALLAAAALPLWLPAAPVPFPKNADVRLRRWITTEVHTKSFRGCPWGVAFRPDGSYAAWGGPLTYSGRWRLDGCTLTITERADPDGHDRTFTIDLKTDEMAGDYGTGRCPLYPARPR